MNERVIVEELESGKPRTQSLKIHVQEEALRKGLERIARDVSRQIRIPGFRPGRAPYPIVERHVGRRYLLEEFVEREIDNLVQEALDLINVKPAYPLELVHIDLEPLTIQVDVPLEPTVDLGDYLNIRIPYEPPQVTEEDVDKFFEDLLASRGTWEPVDEPAQAKDRVTATVSIQVGDHTEKDENVEIPLDEESYLPGFVEELVGVKAGDVREFDLPVPEDHPWREHGEEAHFTVTVHEVKRLNVPELTPELIKELNPDVETEEELREIVRENLQQERERLARQEYQEKVLEAVEEQATVEFPPVLVERYLDEYIRHLKEYFQRLGITWDQYLSLLQKSEEEIREERREEAEKSIRREIIVDHLIKTHHLSIRHQDVRDVALDYISRYGMLAEEFWTRLNEDESFRQEVIRDAGIARALAFLADIAMGKPLEEAVKGDEETEASEGEDEGKGDVTEETSSEEVARAEGDEGAHAGDTHSEEEKRAETEIRDENIAPEGEA